MFTSPFFYAYTLEQNKTLKGNKMKRKFNETIKVHNINERPNQFLIVTPEGHYFQSYKTLIAFRDNDNQVWLDENHWDYSTTTGKYRNIFLNENKKLTQKKIDHSIYLLADLNKRSLI